METRSAREVKWPQPLHDAQLELEHEPQELPPTLVVVPPLPLLKAANRDIKRSAFDPPHSGQVVGASALLMGRRRSNLQPQALQRYS